ncbi:HU family DNA-binding protein [Cereibacter sphaeroides]|uniref:HU family DNA-binding protein n=1 Tax=Cereibacter sphaeroides TaxID=1063 RepID=UPI001F30006A|nr:HU family DNA-binding protein [Cereibacter sphaeroides]MCE6959566.1 HU family DNA-binding protein [Cereibacter sphaeroides]MCE6974574.1 HU family DNA-binding protein [Cereibacter sphaeroides]
MSNTLTKAKLIAALAEATQTTKKEAGATLDALASIVKTELTAGATVTLPGLVKISLRERAERQVRNPATGETMTKPADKTVKVAAVRELKEAAA